jgi:magnesium chelatase subunit D
VNDDPATSGWPEIALAVEIFAVAPFAIGGLMLRAGPGPIRDRVCDWLKASLPSGVPPLRLPLHITEDRLLGGLSLAATLRAGRPIHEQGLLSQAHGGVLFVAMAERLERLPTSHLCAALDRGELPIERDGLTAIVPCQPGLVALDEGIAEEQIPAALRDRLALQLDLSDPSRFRDPICGGRSDGGQDSSARAVLPQPQRQRVEQARVLLPAVELSDDVAESLCAAALALGIASPRAPLLAAAVARSHAALHGRTEVDETDAAVAARLVLGPRATCLPALDEPPAEDDDPRASEPPPEPPPSPPPAEGPDSPPPPGPESPEPQASRPPLDEIVLQAAKSAIPAGLLDAVAVGREPGSIRRHAGQAGALCSSSHGGRPAGVRHGQPGGGERLNVVETLRAAAPWQPLRRREGSLARRIDIRREDFRVTRFKQRSETSVIFSVDASGSAALQRLAEAKGAVEQVLVDCYVRRDHVALIAFRGTAAQLLLSPTRSLLRVRRNLADLAGGGTTPLAAGIDAALGLGLEARRRGQTPLIVLMTDGRANIARDGREGRSAAEADALAGARAVRGAGVRAIFLDTSPRPQAKAQALASAMGARYVPLPYVDAARICREVQAVVDSP